jgi:hypothetical protein
MDWAAPSVRLRTDERHMNSSPSAVGPLIRRLSLDAGRPPALPSGDGEQRPVDAPNSLADPAASHPPGHHRIPSRITSRCRGEAAAG